MTDVLPAPSGRPLAIVPALPDDRWRPTRAGLVSVWRYVEETFEFHRGRLLLRGPNGSGKSMALELLLPFLLDADASPSRLTSAAKSRGGLFDRVMTGSNEPSRTGFVWVEFRRGTETFTVGARLRGSQSTRKVDVDYFTTDLAVGRDLHLLDERRVPLSLKDLKEAIGRHGRVHASGDEHRAAVRDTLYEGFGASRYASVVTALLALRKEKLSQNLDLDKLSDVLSEALPPLDDHDIAAVAEGFERLDRRRAQLESLRTDLATVSSLETRQRTYARIVLASVTDAVRAAESERDKITRTAREAAEALVAARDDLAAHERETNELNERVRDANVRIEAVIGSDAYRQGAGLADLRAQLTTLQAYVNAAVAGAAAADERLGVAIDRWQGAKDRFDVAVGNLRQADADLRRRASDADADAVLDGAASSPVDTLGTTDADAIDAVMRAHLNARRSAIGEVRQLLDVHARATRDRDLRGADVDEAIERLDAALAALTEAEQSYADAVARYADEVEQWVRGCGIAGVERVRAALGDGDLAPHAVLAAAAAVRSDLRSEHAVERQALVDEQRSADLVHVELTTERDLLAVGGIIEPPVPTWRDDRAGLAGAPLWKLVEPASQTPPETVDAIESALAASGLLDAWIAPDGSIGPVHPDGHADLVLTMHEPVPGDSLAAVLEPLPNEAVAAATVRAVLGAIALAPSVGSADPTVRSGAPVVIGRDGSYRLGSAFGQAHPTAATFLGAQAQERRRLARLAELDLLIETNRSEHRRLGDAVGQLAQRHRAAELQLDAAPSGDSVTGTARTLDDAVRRHQHQLEQLADRRAKLGGAEAAVADSLRRLTSSATQHRVPTDLDGLTELGARLDLLERAASAWTARCHDLARAERDVVRERSDVEQLEVIRESAHEASRSSERDLRDQQEKIDAIQLAVGDEYDAVLTHLDALRQQRSTHQRRLDDLQRARPALDKSIGTLESTLAITEHQRATAEEHRLSTHRRFERAVEHRLTADAGVAVSDADLETVTAVLAAARRVAAELSGVASNDQARDQANGRVEEQLHQARQRLGGRVDLDRAVTDAGWSDLTAAQHGIRRRVHELAAAMRGELESASAELLAEEEQLFTRVLAGDIRRALAERIRHANALVEQINAQLGRVRTAAAGVQVRLGWDVDPEQPDAVRSARSLLLRDPGDLAATETAALQAFVRARVDQARSDLELNAPWEARLRETLDYRAWHRFTLQLAHRDWEGYRPATARRLQTLSTGERSIALHLPMLASIAAHYTASDGRPATCPRLILLDELFAGVDPSNRSQLFACFTDWDLDAVFTSDHEWCQYSTLDGIAIHHLHPPSGDDPVTSTRFTWDGHERLIDPPAP